jgi:hypothetical protein
MRQGCGACQRLAPSPESRPKETVASGIRRVVTTGGRVYARVIRSTLPVPVMADTRSVGSTGPAPPAASFRQWSVDLARHSGVPITDNHPAPEGYSEAFHSVPGPHWQCGLGGRVGTSCWLHGWASVHLECEREGATMLSCDVLTPSPRFKTRTAFGRFLLPAPRRSCWDSRRTRVPEYKSDS